MNKKTFEEDSNSFLESLKNEWKLFWHGLVGDEEPAAEQLTELPMDQYKELMQMLSQDRRRLNLHIEKIHREIDAQNNIIQSLQLVSGDISVAQQSIAKLNEIGMNLSLELKKIDEKITKLRGRETSPSDPPP